MDERDEGKGNKKWELVASAIAWFGSIWLTFDTYYHYDDIVSGNHVATSDENRMLNNIIIDLHETGGPILVYLVAALVSLFTLFGVYSAYRNMKR